MPLTCQHCGVEFERTPGRGRRPRFCSGRCRVAAHRAKTPRPFPPVMADAARWVRADGKRPIRPDGSPASSTKPHTWHPLTEVTSGAGDGFGIMLGGGLGCYDLDHMSDAEAAEYIESIPEPILFIERSVSGEGWHIFVEAPEGRGWKAGRVERYTRARFIRTTGNQADPREAA